MGLHFYVEKVESTDVWFTFGMFNTLRHRIARSIGLKDVYAGTDTDMYLTGKFKEIDENHPMHDFLIYSDCDGRMEPEECGQVAAYLKTIIEEWEIEKNYTGINDEDLELDIKNGKKLTELLQRCFKNVEALLFI
jgi:hypothetical protein